MPSAVTNPATVQVWYRANDHENESTSRPSNLLGTASMSCPRNRRLLPTDLGKQHFLVLGRMARYVAFVPKTVMAANVVCCSWHALPPLRVETNMVPRQALCRKGPCPASRLKESAKSGRSSTHTCVKYVAPWPRGIFRVQPHQLHKCS